MKLTRKVLSALGAIFLAALLLVALAPRAARGVAAALVLVSNTSANPVPTLDAASEFPFTVSPVYGIGIDPSLSEFTVPSTTSTGAAVKRLVIEQVSALCEIDPTSQDVSASLQTGLPPNMETSAPTVYFPLVLSSPDNSSDRLVINPTVVRIYVAPGITVYAAFAGSIGLGGGICHFNVTGHLETQ
ncbi:MAG: hypothetical protein WB680_21995 [Candidatus Acidiferrales bacterium]